VFEVIKGKKVSEAELEVMKILWSEKQPVDTNTIHKNLQEKMGWDRSTVRTLIKRLLEKDVIHLVKQEVFCYIPNITEKEYLNVSTISFVNKLYGGSVKNLVASLVQNKELSREDIEELREFLLSGGDQNE
jgi:BlaI family penicillinase repressor